MSVQAYLGEHHVFSLEAFRSAEGEGRTPYNLLVRAVKNGLADRVQRGVYVSRSGRFSNTDPDPYLVASTLADDVVMVYHSALELHGLAQSPSRRVQFASARGVAEFEYRGFLFERHEHPKLSDPSDLVQTTMLTRRPEGVVRVSTRERTLVDCVNRMDASGGLEEVARSVASLPYVDASNVMAYLTNLKSPTAVARTGWFLEQRAKDWYVDDDVLEQMRSLLGHGPYYLTRNNEAGTWVPSWRLYLPVNSNQIKRWVHE